jgi:hypothetical protein
VKCSARRLYGEVFGQSHQVIEGKDDDHAELYLLGACRDAEASMSGDGR